MSSVTTAKKDLRAFVPQVIGTADAVSARLGYKLR